MNVQEQGQQHNSFFLIERLTRRIMKGFYRPQDSDVAYLAAYNRVKDMDDGTLFRYVNPHLTREVTDMERIARDRRLVCEDCFCGNECDIDHSVGISLREIMIHLICQEVSLEMASWEAYWEHHEAA